MLKITDDDVNEKMQSHRIGIMCSSPVEAVDEPDAPPPDDPELCLSRWNGFPPKGSSSHAGRLMVNIGCLAPGKSWSNRDRVLSNGNPPPFC